MLVVTEYLYSYGSQSSSGHNINCGINAKPLLPRLTVTSVVYRSFISHARREKFQVQPLHLLDAVPNPFMFTTKDPTSLSFLVNIIPNDGPLSPSMPLDSRRMDVYTHFSRARDKTNRGTTLTSLVTGNDPGVGAWGFTLGLSYLMEADLHLALRGTVLLQRGICPQGLLISLSKEIKPGRGIPTLVLEVQRLGAVSRDPFTSYAEKNW